MTAWAQSRVVRSSSLLIRRRRCGARRFEPGEERVQPELEAVVGSCPGHVRSYGGQHRVPGRGQRGVETMDPGEVAFEFGRVGLASGPASWRRCSRSSRK